MKKILAVALVLAMAMSLCAFVEPSPSFNPTTPTGTNTNYRPTATTTDNEAEVIYLAANPDVGTAAGRCFARAQEVLGVDDIRTVVTGDLSALGDGKIIVKDMCYASAKSYPAQTVIRTGLNQDDPFALCVSPDGDRWTATNNYVYDGKDSVSFSISEPVVVAILVPAA